MDHGKFTANITPVQAHMISVGLTPVWSARGSRSLTERLRARPRPRIFLYDADSNDVSESVKDSRRRRGAEAPARWPMA